MDKFCTTCDKFVNKEEQKFCKSNRHEIIPMLVENQINEQTNKKQKSKVKGTIGDFFVESILVDSKPTFLCMHKPTDKLVVLDNIDAGDYIVKPLDPYECGYFPYSFTKEEIDRLIAAELSKESLLDEVKLKIDRFVNVREVDKHLILGDILLSYCQEWISTIHYPFFVGETESGKSSCLHLFKRMGYRCLYSDGIPNADIYNFLGMDEEGAGIIAEDEAQNLTDNKDKITTYKNSYSRGAVKPRIVTTSYAKKQVFYKTFCLKIFAGEKIPYDKGLLERLVIVHMIEGTTEGNIKRLTPEEEFELNELRNKLLVWKVQNIARGIDRIESGLKQRDQELWEDFLSVVNGTKYFEKCKNTAAIYIEQRHEAIKNSLEAKILKLVTDKLDKKFELSFVQLWGYITDDNSDLPGRLDKNGATFYPDDYYRITKNSLSRLLEDKVQAVKKTRYEQQESKYHKKTYYAFKSEVIQKLVQKYGIDLVIDSPLYSGSSSQSGQTIQESLDHSDHFDHLGNV